MLKSIQPDNLGFANRTKAPYFLLLKFNIICIMADSKKTI